MYIYYFYLLFFIKITYIVSYFFAKLWLPSGFSPICEKSRDKEKRFKRIWNPTHKPISSKYWTQALFRSYYISNKRILYHIFH